MHHTKVIENLIMLAEKFLLLLHDKFLVLNPLHSRLVPPKKVIRFI
jgi:hypothetical protein